MADDDDLANDPEAKALRPKVSKRTLVAAVIAGALFGIALTVVSLVFDSYIPRLGLRSLPDAGPAEVPDIAELDAGAPDASSDWLE